MIHHYNIQSLAIELYKFLNDYTSEHLQDIFQHNKNKVNCNLRRNVEFSRPSVRTVSFGEKSLNHFGSVVWEIIPLEIKQANSVNEFKDKIRKWKPDKCPYKLCQDFVSGLGFVTLYE